MKHVTPSGLVYFDQRREAYAAGASQSRLEQTAQSSPIGGPVLEGALARVVFWLRRLLRRER